MLKNLAMKFLSRFAPVASASWLAGNGYSSSYGSGAKYPGGMTTRPVVIHDHFALRQKARDAMYDSTVARAMVDRFADTVVETGLRLKPTPDYDLLGIKPEDAEAWTETVASRFHLWAQSKKSSVTRVNNFYQNQHLYHKFQQRDGDTFVRLYYSKEADTTNPLQIDFIDPNQIRGYAWTSTYLQTCNDDGIIRDQNGREIAYKIYHKQADGQFVERTIPARGEKSGRVFMLHGFCPEYAGQGRGYSRLSHALQEFEKITDLSISTIQKAINQSALVMAIENDAQDASNPLEGRSAGPIREYGAFPQPSPLAQGVTDAGTEPVINYEVMPEATITQPGSTGVFNLRRGDKLKYLQDTSPSAQYNTFVDSFCSYLSASSGMPVELLLMKFNNSYSASRAALILFWRVAQMWRDEMAADFLDPTYEMWLSEEIAAGRVSCPGWSDPQLRAAWLCCQWSGCGMPNIDPVKQMNASKMAVELGAETLDDVAREYNGSSGKANRAKLARQFEELPEPAWGWVPGKQNDNSQDGNSDDNADVSNDGQAVTIKSPAGNFDFQMRKRKIKKTVNYIDINGKSKTAEITEEDI